MEYFILNDGSSIPALGIETYTLTPQDSENSVINALNNGYHLIDTANAYMHEKAVGRRSQKSWIVKFFG